MKEDPEKKYPCGWIPDELVCKWCMHFKCPKNTNYASQQAKEAIDETNKELVECLKWNLNWLTASMMLEDEMDQRMRLATCRYLDELAQTKGIFVPSEILQRS